MPFYFCNDIPDLYNQKSHFWPKKLSNKNIFEPYNEENIKSNFAHQCFTTRQQLCSGLFMIVGYVNSAGLAVKPNHYAHALLNSLLSSKMILIWNP